MFKRKAKDEGSYVDNAPSARSMKSGTKDDSDESSNQSKLTQVTARVRFSPAQIKTLETFIKAKEVQERSQSLVAALRHWMGIPRILQRKELEEIMKKFPEPSIAQDHVWNHRFGAGSMFEAWTETTILKSMVRANAVLIRELLDRRIYPKGLEWRIVDMSSSSLWRVWLETLRDDDVGELVLVHPVEEVVEAIRKALPPRVSLKIIDRKASGAVEIPDADIILCGMTLHHIAGRDSAERRDYGLPPGEGKLEAILSIGRALKARDGVGIINEADSFTDITLPPNHSTLVNNILDSYIRRCSLSLLDDIETEESGADPDMKERWKTITRVWCMSQLNAATLNRESRDVYELDVVRWLELLVRANLNIMENNFTDVYGLFHRYVFTVR